MGSGFAACVQRKALPASSGGVMPPPAARVGFAAAAAFPLPMAPALPPSLTLEPLHRIASSQRGLGLSLAAASDFDADTLNVSARPDMAEPLRASAREHIIRMIKGRCEGCSYVGRSLALPRPTPFHYVLFSPLAGIAFQWERYHNKQYEQNTIHILS